MIQRAVRTAWESVECDVLLAPLFEDEDLEQGFAAELDARLQGLLKEIKGRAEWKGKVGQILVLHRPAGLRAARLFLCGVGKQAAYDAEQTRKAATGAGSRLRGQTVGAVCLCGRSDLSPALEARAFVEGLLLGTFPTDAYKSEDQSRAFDGNLLFLLQGDGEQAEIECAMRRGEVLARAANCARRLVDEPGNQLGPKRLAEEARKAAERHGLEIEIWDEPQMVERGMNAVLAVGRGSDQPPRFIILKYPGGGEARPLVLVGKGVTFDSGGLSLKPTQSMEDMKADKAGACAVLSAVQAMAELGVKRNVVVLIPAVENLPSGRAQRPGDVIRSLSGKTIEVLNTDAEGRLILADALHFARSLNPLCIVDVATLTGACVVALGQFRAGLFCNNEAFYGDLTLAAKRAGEKYWRLPLDDEYRKELDSRIADLKNVGSRWGGAVVAAKFLQEFIGDVPWCHLDIAGVDQFPDGAEIKGPTGFAVRTLVELAEALGAAGAAEETARP